MIVMAIFAVLMGLGAGWIQNVGRTSRAAEARTAIRDTAYACQQSSNGGTRAILELRTSPRADGGERLVVGASIARPVLTHHFEALERPSGDEPAKVEGHVEHVADGYVGRAARLTRGGWLRLGPRASFAMTEGVAVEAWLKPEGGAAKMTVLEGAGAYALELQQAQSGGYDVALVLWLKPVEGGRAPGVRTAYTTKDAPVRPGRWSFVQASFDGQDASIRVDELERLERRRKAPAETADGGASPAPGASRRLAVPEGGAVTLTLGAPQGGYVGLMDSLQLSGVFRAAELERDLPGVRIHQPKLPWRLVYRNGRLDPEVHASDEVVVLREESNAAGPGIEFRFGLHGAIDVGVEGRRP
jgi:hypothetical protein